MRRLALDLATVIGWAATDKRRPSGIAFGTETMPPDVSDGRVAALFVDWLWSMCDRYDPAEIGVERAFVPTRMDPKTDKPIQQPAQVNKAYGWYWLTALVCERRGIRIRRIASMTAKKALTGRGHAEKKDVVEACRARGLDVKGFDDADAIAVLIAMASNELEKSDTGLPLDVPPPRRSRR